jgi:hypothetical protein
MSDRCYLRGLTPLGLFNTICGCLFNRVLVRTRDTETHQVTGYYWDIATKHPSIHGRGNRET